MGSCIHILHFLNINIQFLYSYLGILTYNCEANVIRSTSTMLRLEIESVEKRKEVEMPKSKTTRLFSCKERKSTGMSDFPAFFGVKYVRITFLIFPLGLVFSRNSFYKKHKNLQGILFLRQFLIQLTYCFLIFFTNFFNLMDTSRKIPFIFFTSPFTKKF